MLLAAQEVLCEERVAQVAQHVAFLERKRRRRMRKKERLVIQDWDRGLGDLREKAIRSREMTDERWKMLSSRKRRETRLPIL